MIPCTPIEVTVGTAEAALPSRYVDLAVFVAKSNNAGIITIRKNGVELDSLEAGENFAEVVNGDLDVFTAFATQADQVLIIRRSSP